MRGFLCNPLWHRKYKAGLVYMNIERYPGSKIIDPICSLSSFLPEKIKYYVT